VRRILRSGLRARLVAALVFTSAVTLVVAAATLLPPLDRRLKHEEVQSLLNTAIAARPAFQDLRPSGLQAGNRHLESLLFALERRAGARVALFDSTGRVIADTRRNLPFGVVPDALGDNRPKGHVDTSGGAADEARVGIPIHIARKPYVLALAKPLDDVKSAVRVVKRAFLTAAVVGLVVALVLGALITTRLLGRLERLRHAALEVADRGLGAEVAADPSGDEVGDLSHAFRTMQHRLRRQEEARRAFVGTASHELRTPLASIHQMLELLGQDLDIEPPDIEDARVQTARAREQSERLNALATDLLDLTRLDADTPLRREPVELGELARAVSAEFDLRAEARRVRLSLADAPEGFWASGDPGSVARVLRILVDNALRFAPEGSEVEVTPARFGEQVGVVVSDSGPGVPPEERELIFDRFHRGSNTGGGGGFGLGLAIGRELARRMGGDVSLEDSVRGARFALRLPAESVRELELAREPV
jgi:signal transduction histidine kinase